MSTRFLIPIKDRTRAQEKAFITTWKTDNTGTSNNNQITLPLVETTGVYDFTVDWGDGNSDDIDAWDAAAKTHTYSSSGTYTIRITGTITGWQFADGGDCEKITNIANWGPLAINNDEAFYGCENMTCTATDAPTLSGSMYFMFRDCSSFNGSVANFDTSEVTNMYGMFVGCSSFDQSVSNFDTAKVTNVGLMFNGCSAFDQSVSNFDTSSVTNMRYMFYNADAFDQDISAWAGAGASGSDMQEVTTMENFLGAALGISTANYDAFLEALGDDIDNLQDDVPLHMGGSTYSTTAAYEARNALVNDKGWTITDGGEETSTFISEWTTTGAAETVTLPLLSSGGTYDMYVDWGDGSEIEHITAHGDGNHEYATADDYTIRITGTITGWQFADSGDKLKITNIVNWGPLSINNDEAFYGCANLDATATDAPTLSGSMESMLRDCSSFNGSVASFDTSSVTDMRYMFSGCSSFNGSVSNFDTSSVTDMYSMFAGCSSFNQSVSNFDTAKVTDMYRMFADCSSFDQAVSNFDTAKVTDMRYMFYGCSSFNQSVANFDTSSVTNMFSMFRDCSSFDQSVSNFDTSSVTDMGRMFYNADAFDQDLSAWAGADASGSDMQEVTTMDNFMQLAPGISTANYDAFLIALYADEANLQDEVPLHMGDSTFTTGGDAETAYDHLTAALPTGKGWTITDGVP